MNSPKEKLPRTSYFLLQNDAFVMSMWQSKLVF